MRPAARPVSLLALLGLLVSPACGSGPATATPAGPPAAAARIGLIEWEITASAPALVAGPVTLTVTNAGTTAHDLRLRTRRGDVHLGVLAPGQTSLLQADLTGERTVQLTCTVAGHRQQGMDRHIPVAPPSEPR